MCVCTRDTVAPASTPAACARIIPHALPLEHHAADYHPQSDAKKGKETVVGSSPGGKALSDMAPPC